MNCSILKAKRDEALEQYYLHYVSQEEHLTSAYPREEINPSDKGFLAGHSKLNTFPYSGSYAVPFSISRKI